MTQEQIKHALELLAEIKPCHSQGYYSEGSTCWEVRKYFADPDSPEIERLVADGCFRGLQGQVMIYVPSQKKWRPDFNIRSVNISKDDSKNYKHIKVGNAVYHFYESEKVTDIYFD